MKDIINRVKGLFKKKTLTEEQALIAMLSESLKTTDAHMVALARLMFIKPEVWVREVNNVKANAEYLLKMLDNKNEKPN